MARYLQMDGVDDWLKTVSMTFDRIEMDCYVDSTQNNAYPYLMDARSGSNGFISNAYTPVGSSIATMMIDGVTVEKKWSSIPKDKRVNIVAIFDKPYTDDINFFSDQYGTNWFTKGRLYVIKIYNGSTLVAEYDTSTNTVLNALLDKSGNGYNASLTGGTWIFEPEQDKKYSLYFDPSNAYNFSTPQVTVDKIVMEFSYERFNTSGSYYILDGRGSSPDIGTYFYISSSTYALNPGPGIKEYKLNGVLNDKSALLSNFRYNVEITFTESIISAADGINIFQHNQNLSSMRTKGRIYKVIGYNGLNKVFEYDLTKGNANDISGNNNNGITSNVIYFEEPKKQLIMDGIDDYLIAPQLTITDVEMDFIYEKSSATLAQYLFDGRGGTPTGNFLGYITLDGLLSKPASATNVTINDVVDNSSPKLTEGVRYKVKWSFPEFTPDANGIEFYVNYAFQSTSRSKGKLYSIKLYNGSTLIAHYDISTGAVLDRSGNGNHAKLYGGTWEEQPIYYLSMDGVDDGLKISSFQMNAVEIECFIEATQSQTSYYLLDARNGLPNGYAYQNGIGSDWTSLIVDGVTVTKSWANIPKGKRTVVKFTANTFTDDINIFNRNIGTENLKGKIYKVTCYLDGVIKAQYDMSTGTVLDQSGNGISATLTGGTWVNQAAPSGTIGSGLFSSKQIITKLDFILAALKEAIYLQSNSSFATKNIVFKYDSENLKFNNILYKINNDNYILLNKIFTSGSTMESIKNEIFMNNSDNFPLYQQIAVEGALYSTHPMKMIIYKDDSSIFNTKQSYFSTSSSNNPVNNIIYKAIQNILPLKSIIYKNSQNSFNFNNKIYLTNSDIFNVKNEIVKIIAEKYALKNIISKNSNDLFKINSKIYNQTYSNYNLVNKIYLKDEEILAFKNIISKISSDRYFINVIMNDRDFKELVKFVGYIQETMKFQGNIATELDFEGIINEYKKFKGLI